MIPNGHLDTRWIAFLGNSVEGKPKIGPSNGRAIRPPPFFPFILPPAPWPEFNPNGFTQSIPGYGRPLAYSRLQRSFRPCAMVPVITLVFFAPHSRGRRSTAQGRSRRWRVLFSSSQLSLHYWIRFTTGSLQTAPGCISTAR